MKQHPHCKLKEDVSRLITPRIPCNYLLLAKETIAGVSSKKCWLRESIQLVFKVSNRARKHKQA